MFSVDFVASLSHSKTLGKDKKTRVRPVVVHGLAFITVTNWLRTGWDLLKNMADFQRDFLLPTPSSCLKCCLRSELRHDTGSHCSTGHGDLSRSPAFCHYHPSLHAIGPRIRDALFFLRLRPHWVWKKRHVISWVVGLNAIKAPGAEDPIAEAELLREFVELLHPTPLPDEKKSTLVRAMETKFSCESAPLVQELECLEDSIMAPFVEDKKKRGGHAQVRMAELGSDPRTKRTELRSSLRKGFYLCFSVKEASAHFTGWAHVMRCLVFDYLRYGYLGSFPSSC